MSNFAYLSNPAFTGFVIVDTNNSFTAAMTLTTTYHVYLVKYLVIF